MRTTTGVGRMRASARGLAGAVMAAAALLAVTPAQALARDQIRIVGSSTVYPFATTVAEAFARSTGLKTPVVESTGTGGGMKLFCAGVGPRYPDIADASRRIKASEVKACAAHGVREIIEVKFGYDGIVIANSRASARLSLSLRQVYLALAKDVPAEGGKLVPNPYRRWSEIDPGLPDNDIEVLGPPPTSGTRDAFVELAMEGGCRTFPEIAALERTDKARYKAICHALREDGRYVEAGENDNLIVQKLIANPQALGIFGFSYLDQNEDKIQGSLIGGVAPTFENIASGAYPLSRALYFYVKKAHVGMVRGIKAYIEAFLSDEATGEDGYLVDKGLIPLPDEERAKVRAQALALAPLER